MAGGPVVYGYSKPASRCAKFVAETCVLGCESSVTTTVTSPPVLPKLPDDPVEFLGQRTRRHSPRQRSDRWIDSM